MLQLSESVLKQALLWVCLVEDDRYRSFKKRWSILYMHYDFVRELCERT